MRNKTKKEEIVDRFEIKDINDSIVFCGSGNALGLDEVLVGKLLKDAFVTSHRALKDLIDKVVRGINERNENNFSEMKASIDDASSSLRLFIEQTVLAEIISIKDTCVGEINRVDYAIDVLGNRIIKLQQNTEDLIDKIVAMMNNQDDLKAFVENQNQMLSKQILSSTFEIVKLSETAEKIYGIVGETNENVSLTWEEVKSVRVNQDRDHSMLETIAKSVNMSIDNLCDLADRMDVILPAVLSIYDQIGKSLDIDNSVAIQDYIWNKIDEKLFDIESWGTKVGENVGETIYNGLVRKINEFGNSQRDLIATINEDLKEQKRVLEFVENQNIELSIKIDNSIIAIREITQTLNNISNVQKESKEISEMTFDSITQQGKLIKESNEIIKNLSARVDDNAKMQSLIAEGLRAIFYQLINIGQVETSFDRNRTLQTMSLIGEDFITKTSGVSSDEVSKIKEDFISEIDSAICNVNNHTTQEADRIIDTILKMRQRDKKDCGWCGSFESMRFRCDVCDNANGNVENTDYLLSKGITYLWKEEKSILLMGPNESAGTLLLSKEDLSNKGINGWFVKKLLISSAVKKIEVNDENGIYGIFWNLEQFSLQKKTGEDYYELGNNLKLGSATKLYGMKFVRKIGERCFYNISENSRDDFWQQNNFMIRRDDSFFMNETNMD